MSHHATASWSLSKGAWDRPARALDQSINSHGISTNRAETCLCFRLRSRTDSQYFRVTAIATRHCNAGRSGSPGCSPGLARGCRWIPKGPGQARNAFVQHSIFFVYAWTPTTDRYTNFHRQCCAIRTRSESFPNHLEARILCFFPGSLVGGSRKARSSLPAIDFNVPRIIC
jgi:hypothetical protein